ncbi:GcrA cell cycle regulator [Gluconacetobacter aggeris]|uniref:GcrA cell cycle regulator n=1 Tax=Gluconacetobacter aggeris TaxID=1286186 RepID=A0A7W4IW11_9PROT|nr:GcrA family cell cycle regulator [Gluconacetobacter aggeris]MBB2170061.1 GcrA cell cycle regulator [Gluconacetobacter aggeris]
MAMEWTEETIARLRELWQQGLSTAEIGRQLSVTKNAVVGKAHRLGLQARPSPIRRPPASARAAESAGAVAPTPEPVAAAPAPVASPVSPAAPVAAAAVAPQAAAPVAPVMAPVAPHVAAAAPSVAPVRQAEPAPRASGRAEPETVAEVAPSPPVATPSVSRPETPRASLRAVSSPAPRRSGLSCCWPLGDPGTPGFHFCGATPVPGKPYCAEHAQLAYVKLRDRRDNVA